MTFEELTELHYITPIKNLGSILSNGILSHERANQAQHETVAMAEIQDVRATVVLPNKRKLHTYTNLYINCRNPMMYKRQQLHRELCVVRVDKSIVQEPSVIVTDQNAAAIGHVRFSAGIAGLSRIEKETVFAKYWTHSGDQIATWRHKAAMCAEVLVPDCVPPAYIEGVYVSCEESKAEVEAAFPDLDVVVRPYLFFR